MLGDLELVVPLPLIEIRRLVEPPCPRDKLVPWARLGFAFLDKCARGAGIQIVPELILRVVIELPRTGLGRARFAK